MTEASPERSELAEERKEQLIEAVARRIEALGLSTPAILMLEANKPLSFLGSQAILILQPILNFALDQSTSQEFAQLLADRQNVERLIQRLERQVDGAQLGR